MIGENIMGLRCKSEKIEDGIMYIMVRNERNGFDIEIVINNKTYESYKETQYSAQRWIDQKLKTQHEVI